MTNSELIEFQRIFEEQMIGGTVLEWPEYDIAEGSFEWPEEMKYDRQVYEWMQLMLMGYQWGLANASV